MRLTIVAPRAPPSPEEGPLTNGGPDGAGGVLWLGEGDSLGVALDPEDPAPGDGPESCWQPERARAVALSSAIIDVRLM